MSHKINTINAEEKAYQLWERETKNRILAITNPERRQALWTKLFGVKEELDDSYLLGNIY